MRRFLLALALLLIPSVASPMQMIGFGEEAGGSCDTQSFDVQYTTKDTTSAFLATDERGQSWVAGVSGDLYSVYFEKNDAGAVRTLTIRIGTSANLSSSYLVEFTCNTGASAGFFQCVIPSESRPTLSASTTYHLLMRTDGEWVITRDGDPAGYTDGVAYYDTTKDWIGTSSLSDLPFKTKMCD